jgi:hypothetical protein
MYLIKKVLKEWHISNIYIMGKCRARSHDMKIFTP